MPSHENGKNSERHFDALCRAITLLETEEEARRFLYDLCTQAEIHALSERWHVATLLEDTGFSYREIHRLTGVSTTTIARVARFLNNEPHQGYRLMIDRLKEENRK